VGNALHLENRQQTRRVNLRLFRKIISAALKDLSVQQFDLGIYIVGAKEMTELNETFLRHKGSTDVITFDYGEPRTPLRKAPRIVPALHGEIFVCIHEAIAQAKRFRTSWQSELVRYALHGLLHLLGYDDKRAASRHLMKREEDRLHRELAAGFDLVRIQERTSAT
jgi:probable rRNA maturation factor